MSKLIAELIKNKVPFALLQSVSTVKGFKTLTAKDYEIIMLRCDTKKIDKRHLVDFYINNDNSYPFAQRNPTGIISKKMDENEITFLRENLNLFNKISFGLDGNLYELKTLKLKEKYNENYNTNN